MGSGSKAQRGWAVGCWVIGWLDACLVDWIVG